jgi:hypothetical protein
MPDDLDGECVQGRRSRDVLVFWPFRRVNGGMSRDSDSTLPWATAIGYEHQELALAA